MDALQLHAFIPPRKHSKSKVTNIFQRHEKEYRCRQLENEYHAG